MASWSGGPEPAPEPEPQAGLELLAAELGGEQLAATLITANCRRPHLRVTNRAATLLTEAIYSGRGYFWWSWAERIEPVWNVAAAAEKVRQVLRVPGNGAAAGGGAECACVVGNEPLRVTSSIQGCGVHGGGL